jgi:hypothetical protein
MLFTDTKLEMGASRISTLKIDKSLIDPSKPQQLETAIMEAVNASLLNVRQLQFYKLHYTHSHFLTIILYPTIIRNRKRLRRS